MEEKAIEVVLHPPYSPDLAPADYFLFPTIKRELGGVSISGDSVKVEWERACGRVPSDAFAAAFGRWIERLKKFWVWYKLGVVQIKTYINRLVTLSTFIGASLPSAVIP